MGLERWEKLTHVQVRKYFSHWDHFPRVYFLRTISHFNSIQLYCICIALNHRYSHRLRMMQSFSSLLEKEVRLWISSLAQATMACCFETFHGCIPCPRAILFLHIFLLIFSNDKPNQQHVVACRASEKILVVTAQACWPLPEDTEIPETP